MDEDMRIYTPVFTKTAETETGCLSDAQHETLTIWKPSHHC